MTSPYAPPVDQLLALGSMEWGDPWRDYAELGITTEHVPELIRLLLDQDVLFAPSESVEMWGSVHAWRALGQLRAEAAIEPLLQVMELDDDGDWTQEEVPTVLGMIGPAALEPVRASLARLAREEETFVAMSVANALVEIGRRFPETRADAIDALQRQLRWWGRQDEGVNAALVSDLVDLKAVEALPLIQEAFEAGAVDEMYRGDLEDIQVELGLISERKTPPAARTPRPIAGLVNKLRRLNAAPTTSAQRDASAEAKRRRKAQKAARQRNRKHKKKR